MAPMPEMVSTVAPIIGFLLVLAVLLDVFLYVLESGGGTGLIASRVSRGIWFLFVRLGRVSPGERRWWKRWAGPTILVMAIFTWVSGIVVGFAFIFWPTLGEGIQFSHGATSETFATALYFSAFCFTTLGVGDFYAVTDAYRLVMVVEAGLGFSMLTLAFSYITGIYTAIQTRNALAIDVHAFSHEDGDAVHLAEVLMRPDEGRMVANQLRGQLNQFYTAHHQYPMIHYFRFEQVHYSSVRFLLLVQDALSLTRTLPQSRELSEKLAHSSYDALERVLRTARSEFVAMLAPGRRDEGLEESEKCSSVWRERYLRACRFMERKQVPLEENSERSVDAYCRLREQWEPDLRHLSAVFDEPWEMIDCTSAWNRCSEGSE